MKLGELIKSLEAGIVVLRSRLSELSAADIEWVTMVIRDLASLVGAYVAPEVSEEED